MRTTFLLLLCLCIVGCHMTRAEKREEAPADLPDISNIELAEAAIAVSHSLEDLTAITAERQVARVEPQTQEQLDYTMLQLASVDWVGPAEPIIERLAQAVNYHVRIIGKAPPHVVIVDLDKDEVSVGELFRDIALQIERDADLVIFPQSKLIELQYH